MPTPRDRHGRLRWSTQAGGQGTGAGGPGYKFKNEDTGRDYTRGTLAMENAGRDTNGSQFFITLGPTPWLDNRHTIFGEVADGLDAVRKIGKTPVGRQDRPAKDITIQSVTIQRVD